MIKKWYQRTRKNGIKEKVLELHLSNQTRNVRKNVTVRRFCATTVAVENQ